ncbi:phosphohydrolase [Candidatus Woesearchaeota archaeon CG11_big_fil_rev_8_21_14_0_20_43_8]|nr:MAG: phosphohydrolase [Candidatus Woesearchaeota archaeon CG11_big_fil_rev_8_21_14_0_20_43_8]PIO06109.1 MAG: phosphohydrolase [Candidatus Woesearchaeota archaeon CG08_land_8_20_14_0_20_43_7]
MLTVSDIRKDDTVRQLIKHADSYLESIKFTKHGEVHASNVSWHAKDILLKLGFDNREAELAAISGYIHDVGNFINRQNHEITGATLAMKLLDKLGMDLKETLDIAQAIGNHDEKSGIPVSNITAAVIIADKCDVHRSRVRSKGTIHDDIHDRVNYAVKKASLKIFKKKKIIQLALEIDTAIAAVIDYFEIFLSRMVICKKAADFLGCKFELVINGNKLV